MEKLQEKIQNKQEQNFSLIKQAEQDIERIAPFVKEKLIPDILNSKPENIVFLDKGARIFATPFKKILEEQDSDYKPKILFFNDSKLKESYMSGTLDALLENLSVNSDNERYVFIDETYSAGKGAATLKKIKDKIGINLKYYALSKATVPQFAREGQDNVMLSHVEHQVNEKLLQTDSDFIINNEKLDNLTLFSKEASKLYVDESVSGKTISKFNEGGITDEQESNRNKAISQMMGLSEIELDTLSSSLKSEDQYTVRQLKSMIYKSFKA